MSTKNESILRRNPYRDRRSFVARAMGLSPIGDIASGGMTEDATTATVTWETSTDWDNAVSEEYVEHGSDVVNLAVGLESWEDQADGNSLPSPWSQVDGSAEIDSSRSFDGSLSAKSTNEGNSSGANYERTWSTERTPSKITYTYQETSNSFGHHYAVLSNGNYLFGCGTGNSQSFYIGDGSYTTTVDPGYGVWVTYTFTNIDFSAETFDVEWQVDGGSSGSATGVSFNNSASGIDSVEVGDDTFDGGNGAQDSWADQLWGVLNTGTLTTGTKAFASATAPNLQNLSYTLNSQNITLDIIGSPGTASEEIVTQVLDGASSYSLSWSNTHSDFRTKATLESTDRSTAPSLSRVELTEP